MYYRKKETDCSFKQASNQNEREASAERMKKVGKQAAAKRRARKAS